MTYEQCKRHASEIYKKRIRVHTNVTTEYVTQ